MSNEKICPAIFTFNKTPKRIFDAVNNVRGWWSGDIERSTDKLGEQFTYRYKDIHYNMQKITELVSGEKVLWHGSTS